MRKNDAEPGRKRTQANHRILAIDPGTREMGIAVLDGAELIYHGVHCTKRRRSPHETFSEARRTVQRLIQDFQPDLVVYEKTFIAKNRNAALLNALTDEIQALARAAEIPSQGIAVSPARLALCGNGRADKAEVARAVVARFPHLKVYLNQDRKWKTKYYGNMFDAVALALAAQSLNSGWK